MRVQVAKSLWYHLPAMHHVSIQQRLHRSWDGNVVVHGLPWGHSSQLLTRWAGVSSL